MAEKKKADDHSLKELRTLRKKVAELQAFANDCAAAKNALKQSQDQYRSLFEEAPDGIYVSSKDGVIIDVNEAALAMFGYKREEMIGMNARDLYVNPDDRKRFKQTIERKGAVKDHEVKLRRKDGSERYCLLTSTVRHAHDGSINGYQGIIHDITQRRRAEEALRLSEEKFSKVFRWSPDWIVISTLMDGRFIDVNDAFLRITGYKRDEVIGRTSLDLGLWVDLEERQRHLNLLLEKGVIQNEEVRYRIRSGEIRIMLRSAEIIDFQGELCAINITRDITDRKKFEEDLLRSEEKYRALMSNASDPILLADIDGNLLEVNRRAEELLGYTKEEFMHMNFAQIHPREGIERTIAAFKDIVKKGSGSLLDALMLTKDGRTVQVDISGCVVEFDGKKVMQGIFRDITERKRAEEEIRKLNQELKQHVVELTEANKELDAFNYSVSHDLRTPLILIGGFSRKVLKNYGERLDATGNEMVQIIRSTTQRMEKLIDDLLAFSRSGRQQITLSDIDMTRMAQSVAGEMQAIFPQREIDFRIHPLPQAQGDQVLIRQVWANIFSNSVKFTEDRPVAIIEVRGSVEGDERVYSVSDNGVGFDMGNTDKLFKVFSRLHKVENYEGSGVGLSIISRIINRHNGRVWAEGRIDHGATFSFSLPAKHRSL